MIVFCPKLHFVRPARFNNPTATAFPTNDRPMNDFFIQRRTGVIAERFMGNFRPWSGWFAAHLLAFSGPWQPRHDSQLLDNI